MGKFDGLTPTELAEYATESVQRSGETDTAWAQRVQLLEAKWVTLAQQRREVEAE